jgi:hypothetical protein
MLLLGYTTILSSWATQSMYILLEGRMTLALSMVICTLIDLSQDRARLQGVLTFEDGHGHGNMCNKGRPRC